MHSSSGSQATARFQIGSELRARHQKRLCSEEHLPAHALIIRYKRIDPLAVLAIVDG